MAERPLLVLGTGNRKKGREMADLLAPVGLELRTLADFPTAIEVAEDGDTFAANSSKKAVQQARHLGHWVLADDSGLAVDWLRGAPGVYSARFSGPTATDASNNQKLLGELSGLPPENRSAQFVCHLVLADPRGTIRGESEGFCRGIYRKVGCRNRDMSNRLAGKLVKFAREHGAEAIVFEYLKHYRPKAGGRSGSTLRQRFHGWLHRALVKKVKEMTAEAEIRTEFVAPAGTSMYAYDGSGLLWRDQKNRTLVVFANGKHYNADLIAAYNIGARFLFRVLHPGLRIETGCAWGKSSPAQPRIPVTLSTLCAA